MERNFFYYVRHVDRPNKYKLLRLRKNCRELDMLIQV